MNHSARTVSLNTMLGGPASYKQYVIEIIALSIFHRLFINRHINLNKSSSFI